MWPLWREEVESTTARVSDGCMRSVARRGEARRDNVSLVSAVQVSTRNRVALTMSDERRQQSKERGENVRR